LALPEEVEHWSLTTLREKLVKIGARIVRHGRYVVFQLAEVDAVRQDPASDRSAAATVAATPGMSIASNHRCQPAGRGVSIIDRERPNAARSRGASLMARIDAVSGASLNPHRLAQMRRNDASSVRGSRPSGESQLSG
jgi:hypothetical protein